MFRVKFSVNLFILLISALNTFAGQTFYEPLQNSQCHALPETKTYLSSVTSQEFVKYKCQYECLDMKGTKQLLWIEHTHFPKPTDDPMNSMVCNGIRIDLKKSELGYVLDQNLYVSNFWANLSDAPEVQAWVKQNNIRLSPEIQQKLKTEFNQIMLKMGIDSAPQAASSPILTEFVSGLLEIGADTEKGKALLAQLLKKIKNKQAPATAGENLLMIQINFYGKFLLLD